MKQKMTDYVAGLFVIFGMILIIAITVIVRGQYNKQDDYYTYFENVAGLKTGAAIIYEGYIIGSVTDITPEAVETGMRFRVDLGVQAGWNIPQDSVAKVAAQSLLSAQAIQIKSGGGQPLSPRSEIRSIQTKDVISDLSDTASELSSLAQTSLQPLLESLTSVIDNEVRMTLQGANKLTGAVEERVPELMGRLDVIFANLEAVSTNLEALVGSRTREQITLSIEQMNTTLGRIDEASSELFTDQNLNRINDSLAQVEQAARLLQKTAEKGYQTAEQAQLFTSDQNMKNVETILSDTVSLQSQIADLVAAAEISAENAARLTSISQDRMDMFLQRMENAALNIEEMTARLRDDPSLIIRGSN